MPKSKKLKQFKFTITVTGTVLRRNAETSILCCFAGRKPDGMRFLLNNAMPAGKKVWITVEQAKDLIREWPSPQKVSVKWWLKICRKKRESEVEIRRQLAKIEGME